MEPLLADRISRSGLNLLVLCNGHGEDLIALRVIEALHKIRPDVSIEVLPLVGEGKAFQLAISQGWLRKIGPSITLPSGGFSNQSFRGFIADLFVGVLKVTWQQWLCAHKAAIEGRVILAVGDLLPLFFAWSSKAPFGFIGAPKSDYTWMSGPGIALSDFYHRWKGTEWDPWEWALMCSSRCKMVAVRDQLTARGLRRKGVEALFLGNPMMDGFQKLAYPDSLKSYRRLVLLCGSRMPEARDNLKRLFSGLSLIDPQISVAVLVALGAEPDLFEVESLLKEMGYKKRQFFDAMVGSKSSWQKDSHLILIGPGKFSLWAPWGEVGLANAGTATEQLVGLGIPALSFPGPGPQFKKNFAMRQSRLLGGAVMPCSSPEKLAFNLELLFANQVLRQELGHVGMSRMGTNGGSSSLANLILTTLFAY